LAKVVALPILHEWEVRRGLRKPKIDNDLLSNAENWYLVKGLPSKWQNNSPSKLGLICRKLFSKFKWQVLWSA
jgi:hypothetical protein